VAAPAQQRSQVILRSENPLARSPGCTFFLKKVDNLFLVTALKIRVANAVSPSTKLSDMVTFLFSVHTITEGKQYAGLGRAEPKLEPGRWIFQPDHLTWRALV